MITICLRLFLIFLFNTSLLRAEAAEQIVQVAVSPTAPGITDKNATLGLRDLAPEDEQMIRALLADYRISFRETLYIKWLAPEVESATAYTGCYWPKYDVFYWYAHEPLRILFVGNYFLKVLSEDERLFFLMHEMAHLEKNHGRTNLTFGVLSSIGVHLTALLAGVITFGLYADEKNLVSEIALLPHPLRDIWALQLGVGMYCGISWQLSSLQTLCAAWLSQYIEHDADYIAVKKIGNAKGAISAFTRMRSTLPPDVGYTWFQKMLGTHPTYQARINRVSAAGVPVR